MKAGLPIDGVHSPYLLAGLYLVSGFHSGTLKFAIERELVPVLYKHTYIVARHHHYLLDHAVKYGIDRSSG